MEDMGEDAGFYSKRFYMPVQSSIVLHRTLLLKMISYQSVKSFWLKYFPIIHIIRFRDVIRDLSGILSCLDLIKLHTLESLRRIST